MKYYDEIKDKLISNEIYMRVKDYSKERNKIETYYQVGKILYEAGKHYGDNIIGEYSKRLIIEVGKKYNKRTLYRMRKFYVVFSNEKVTTMLTNLTWSHYLLLLSLKNYDEIIYYIKTSINNNLTQRQLNEKIKNNEYKRLPKETRNKLIKKKENKITDFVPNPIIINNIHKYKNVSEKILHRIIMENIDLFLKELGEGFCFIDKEYKIKLGDEYNYIDLLLYNIKYKCYVVVELKIVPLKKEHIGQIMIYMNYIDDNIKNIEENNTVGIIICKQDNEYIIKYCSDDRIIARYYEIK